MSNNEMSWVDDQEKKNEENRSNEYFNIVEGEQKFQILTPCARLPQVWNNAEKKYRIAEEGDENISVKGLCFVLQDDQIKLAKLPYTVVKSLRALQNNEDWDFDFPFEHVLTLNAKNAGTKEVEYNLTASPKKTPFSQDILDELAKKDPVDDIVEKMKEKQQGEGSLEKARREAKEEEAKAGNEAF